MIHINSVIAASLFYLWYKLVKILVVNNKEKNEQISYLGLLKLVLLLNFSWKVSQIVKSTRLGLLGFNVRRKIWSFIFLSLLLRAYSPERMVDWKKHELLSQPTDIQTLTPKKFSQLWLVTIGLGQSITYTYISRLMIYFY